MHYHRTGHRQTASETSDRLGVGLCVVGRGRSAVRRLRHRPSSMAKHGPTDRLETGLFIRAPLRHEDTVTVGCVLRETRSSDSTRCSVD